VFILFRNLETFLPSSTDNLGNNTVGTSSVVSVIVGNFRLTQPSRVLTETPLEMNFTFPVVIYSRKYLSICIGIYILACIFFSIDSLHSVFLVEFVSLYRLRML